MCGNPFKVNSEDTRTMCGNPFKVNSEDTRTMCEIDSKLTVKTPERDQ